VSIGQGSAIFSCVVNSNHPKLCCAKKTCLSFIVTLERPSQESSVRTLSPGESFDDGRFVVTWKLAWGGFAWFIADLFSRICEYNDILPTTMHPSIIAPFLHPSYLVLIHQAASPPRCASRIHIGQDLQHVIEYI
jgi:hypothetical protein